MPFADINSQKIYFETHGDGDTIIFLHHGFGCTKMWKNIFPSFVQKGYRVVLYDRRGFGQSEKDSEFAVFYESDRFRPECVQELGLLKDLLNIDSFHLVGQCEGGVVAIDYTVKYPHHVKTVTVSSTQCYSEKTMVEFNAEKLSKPFCDLDPEIREKLIDWHGKDYVESFHKQFCSFGGSYGKGVFDLRCLLPSITHPALVLYPDRSILFDVEQGVAFYRHLPRGELAVLPHCGHNTYEEQPEQYIGHIASFLKRHNF